MTEVSRPWAGTSIGDAGPYSDTQWATMFMTMIGVGANSPNRGIVGGVDNELRVTAQSPLANAVDVQTGAALVQGRWYYSDTVASFIIAANGSGNPRIDTVVVRVTFASQIARLALLQGTAAATPAPPALTQNGTTWEVTLATIDVANGFSTIGNDDIKMNRSHILVPKNIGLDLTNDSGGYIDAGSAVLVRFDNGTFGSLVGAQGTGIVSESSNDGEVARVIFYGFTYARFNADVSGAVEFDGVTGVGKAWDGSPNTPTGILLEAFVNATMDVGLCFVDFLRPASSALRYTALEYTAFSVLNNTFTTLNWTTAVINANSGGMWDVADPTRITFAVAGFYVISANVAYDAAFTTTAPPYVDIFLNGTTILVKDGRATGAYSELGQTATLGRFFAAGDYIEMRVFQVSGANRAAAVRFSAVRTS